MPETSVAYTWTAYKSEAGDYSLWVVNADGESFLAKPGEELLAAKPGDPGVGEADSKGIPVSIDGYDRLNTLIAASDKNLPHIKFGIEGKQAIQISSPKAASELKSRFVYDPATDSMTDNSNGDIYLNANGTFTTKDGKTIKPGFRSVVGWLNFVEFATSPALRLSLIHI